MSQARTQNCTIVVIFIILGIGLRLKTYFDFDGLNHDDILLSSNIIRHEESRLLKPLDLDQAGPIGHLLLVKVMTRILGTGEKVLRLPALVASILTLLLFGWLLSRITSPAGQSLGILLVATSEPILYFTASVKQYSGDVLVSVILLIAGFHAQAINKGNGRFVWLGSTGILSIFFSQSSVFLLSGIGLTLISTSIMSRRFRDVIKWIIIASIWLATFLTLYFLIYKAYSANEFLTLYWKDAFAPFPPRSLEDVQWYIHALFLLFTYPLGANFLWIGIPGILSVAGVYRLIEQRQAQKVYTLLLPVLLTLAPTFRTSPDRYL